MQTEVCVDSASGVRVAAAAGADRVELCSALEVGGLTPSMGLIEQAVQASAGSGLQVQVLIRPRPGDFHYQIDEIRCMERDIAAAVAAGAHGVVVGALRVDGSVDDDVLARLVAAARAAGRRASIPVALTFHRAFDVALDPFVALETVRRNGFDRILTSGQAATAGAGAALLAELVRRSGPSDGGPAIGILAGGGIRGDNVAELVRATGVSQVHFSGRARVPSAMRHRNPAVTMGSEDADPYTRLVTDPDTVRAIIAAVGGPAGAADGEGAGSERRPEK
ncbi:copper homeostasis protein CutC [Nakamurella lactea]|uniref:copper homeostasis protein CutC n=1 Tax=Nakamurella lactea TaxID=459515 RepID=UPI001B7FC58B|nr:copper homeostasis protein CutC [Nakamurella lactea]